MRKAYLLAYSSTLGTQDEVKECLNTLPQVITWRLDLPNAIYIISEEEALTLAELIRKCRGGKGRFIITEIPSNSNGWLTPESWFLIQNKRQKPKTPKEQPKP
jgi:hypothetical protein